MRISSKGLALVKSFESFVPYPYDDLVPPKKGVYPEWTGGPVKGTLTIGYGHTDAAKYPLKIRVGLRLTEADASNILDADMDDCEAAVNRLVKVTLSQGQFDALASFTFNCGEGSLANIAARLNRGDYKAARDALGLYVKSKGQTLAGLVRRRKAEQALWDDREPTLPTEPVHHTAEVDAPTAPAPAPIPKPTVEHTIGGAAIGSTAGVFASGSGFPWWGIVLAVVIGAIAGAALAHFLKKG